MMDFVFQMMICMQTSRGRICQRRGTRMILTAITPQVSHFMVYQSPACVTDPYVPFRSINRVACVSLLKGCDCTAVHTAAANGRVAIMGLLSQLYGNDILINPLTKGKPGATPAHAAAIAGRENSLRYIFDNAPPPSSAVFTTSDLRGATPAMLEISH